MKKRIAIVMLLALVVFTGCVKIGEYYVGLNMQPDLTDSPFEPGLNVFGVLKCGSDFDTINYHFEVQNMLDLQDWSTGLEVPDAQIQLTRISSSNEALNYDLSFVEGAGYKNNSIETLPGDRWEYRCMKDSFEVTSSCIVPNLPIIDQSTVEGKEVKIIIEADSTQFLYLVYVFQGDNVYSEFKVPQPNLTTELFISPEWEITSSPVQVYVCAYDRQLREYQTTSNTFFKPNAFRPSFSTVNGGYGTFGAIAISTKIIE
ncbi:MAG: hypothetical protein ACERKD_02635 [Prolixibacteraceae bacterium]